TPAALDTLANTLGADAIGPAIRFIANGCLARALAAEVDASVSCIYDLVNAVKGFTYMDRAAARESIDLGRGIADTLAVLSAKIRAKSVVVRVTLPTDLPRGLASGAELNEVWANLIDNALDAVPPTGHVDVIAREEMDH